MAAPKTNRMKERHGPTIDKARTTQLVKRLISFALNENDDADQKVEMSSVQVTAALGVIKKVIPDLSSTEMKLTETNKQPREYSDAELLERVGSSDRTSSQERGEEKPNSVH